MIRQRVFLFTLLLAAGIWSQQTEQNARNVQQQLQTIQKEITELEKQLKTADNQLKIEINSVEKLDKQINLTHNKISIYKKKVLDSQETIELLRIQIDSLQNKIGTLQEIFRQQAVFAYKYQRGKQFDWLLGSASFNDVFVKYHYFKKVSSAERSIFDQLRASRSDLRDKRDLLNQEIQITEEYLTSSTQEEKNLNRRRSQKSGLIKKIRQNQSLASQALKEKRESYQKLQNILASLEKGRDKRQLQVDTQVKWEKLSGNFARNKGKMNWPVQGKLLHNFGRYRNPELKTVLNNTGIDIQSARGQEVRAVFPGVVSLITYMSGFGNMVIIDHNDGYYTVYAHLDIISVKANDFVEGGSRIGTVGESGSLEGPKLHFEVYGNNETLNPIQWLKKS